MMTFCVGFASGFGFAIALLWLARYPGDDSGE
jgi:hypothetical protein